MKKILSAALIPLILFNMTACRMSVSSEIKNRLIIQGIGLDLTQDNMLELSVQALNTDVSTHASSNTEPDSLVKLYSTAADTLSEAVKKLSEQTGKSPVLSQNRIVVFGYELAKRGVEKYLDDFFRNDENRFSVLTLVSKTTAKEIINANLGENVIPARLTEKILMTADENSEIVKTSMLQLNNSILDSRKCCLLPVAQIRRQTEEADSIAVTGAAVFKGGAIKYTLNKDLIPAVNILTNKVKKAFFTAKTGSGAGVSFELFESKTKISCKAADGRIKFDIKVKGSVSVDEISDANLTVTDEEDIIKLTRLAQEYIKSGAQNSIEQCLVGNGYDLYGFEAALQKEFSLEESDKFNIALLQKAEYNISVKLSIKRLGDRAVNL